MLSSLTRKPLIVEIIYVCWIEICFWLQSDITLRFTLYLLYRSLTNSVLKPINHAQGQSDLKFATKI